MVRNAEESFYSTEFEGLNEIALQRFLWFSINMADTMNNQGLGSRKAPNGMEPGGRAGFSKGKRS
jgi:hypothetical protein